MSSIPAPPIQHDDDAPVTRGELKSMVLKAALSIGASVIVSAFIVGGFFTTLTRNDADLEKRMTRVESTNDSLSRSLEILAQNNAVLTKLHDQAEERIKRLEEQVWKR